MKSKAGQILTVLIGNDRWNRFRQALYTVQDKRNGIGNLLQRNGRFNGAYNGQRCFIIGNGPSAKSIDPDLFKDEIIFSVNQFSKTDLFGRIKPTFHLWSDERFFNLDDNDAGDREILNAMKMARREDFSANVFFKIDAREMIEKYGLDKDIDIYYYADGGLDLCEGFSADFDMTKRFPWCASVVIYCICMAIAMGFKEIYLCGVECTGFINFANQKDASLKMENQYSYSMNNNEQKRFSRVMSEARCVDEMMIHYEVFRQYECLAEYAERNNIDLINCTPGGVLDSLPRKKLEEVLADK